MKFDNKKNILMLSSSSSIGGGTKHMFLLGRNLNNNFEIFYAIPKNSNFQKHLNPTNFINISERKLNLKDIFNLLKFVKSNSIDIIHAHGKGAGVLARILVLFKRKPLIYTFHGIHLQCHKWYIRYIYKMYEYVFGWIDTVKVFVSTSEKNFAKESNIYIGKNSKIINNGVENKKIKEFPVLSDTNKNLTNLSKIKVISVCRFVSQKNIKGIINIAYKLPEIKFNIIGNGPEWREINDLIQENELKNINLLGEKQTIFNYLYSSDICLSTSLYEGLPISILEAMSIGLPIVASNVVGNCDTIINGKSGYLYNIDDIKEAVYYINKLAGNDSLRRQFGRKAFERQRSNFSNQFMINKYINLYSKFF